MNDNGAPAAQETPEQFWNNKYLPKSDPAARRLDDMHLFDFEACLKFAEACAASRVQGLEERLARQWIPVSERLPKVGGTYLVCRKFAEPFAWQVDLGHFFLLETGPTWMDAKSRSIEVRHWMELPTAALTEDSNGG